MKKHRCGRLIFILIVTLLFGFYGCSSKPPSPTGAIFNIESEATLTQSEIAALTKQKVSDAKKLLMGSSSIKIVRQETAPLALVTTKGVAGTIVAGAAFGAVGASVYGIESSRNAGAKLVRKYDLPDYGEILLTKFSQRASIDLRGWPKMDTEMKPVAEDYKDKSKDKDKDFSPFIEFYPRDVSFSGSGKKGGLFVSLVVKIIDSNGNTIFRGTTDYSSKDYGRNKSGEEFEADNAKLLKEELDFAAEGLAQRVIDLLK